MGLHEAPPGQFRLLASPLDSLGASDIDLVGAGRQFVLDFERPCQGDERHQFHQQGAHGVVNAGAGYGLALGRWRSACRHVGRRSREPVDPGGYDSAPSCPARTHRTRQDPATAPVKTPSDGRSEWQGRRPIAPLPALCENSWYQSELFLFGRVMS